MEILIRNPELPEKCGKARISYENNIIQPSRNGETIHLPIKVKHQYADGCFMDLHLLQQKTQFLFSIAPYHGNGIVYESDRLLWFGGTDEEPFLTRLNPYALYVFEQCGEKGFFEYLKPKEIVEMESITGKGTKRQGDIFAMPVPFPWKTIETMARLIRDESESRGELMETEKDGVSVYGTRHRFTGITTSVHIKVASLSLWICEGVLTAPDHQDLELKEPHALFQAANLFDPKNAD